jgi:DNA-binding NarL/FixJ family response regulator
MKWKKILEKRLKELKDSGKRDEEETSFIDLLRSGRRRYIVRGLVLSDKSSSSKRQDNHYLFILERVKPDMLNIPKIVREWNLSKREEDLIQLLSSDLGNKEIAHHLGLSLNTVKSYMKFLMRKLNVNSRVGILSRLFSKE